MIDTAVEIHQVASADGYRTLVSSAMALRRASGYPDAATHEEAGWVEAYISASRWVIDCDCGAGNSVHPDWRLACCLSCGAIRTNIVVPDDRVAIEAALDARPLAKTRNWKAPETVASLLADNTTHGIV